MDGLEEGEGGKGGDDLEVGVGCFFGLGGMGWRGGRRRGGRGVN